MTSSCFTSCFTNIISSASDKRTEPILSALEHNWCIWLQLNIPWVSSIYWFLYIFNLILYRPCVSCSFCPFMYVLKQCSIMKESDLHAYIVYWRSVSLHVHYRQNDRWYPQAFRRCHLTSLWRLEWWPHSTYIFSHKSNLSSPPPLRLYV